MTILEYLISKQPTELAKLLAKAGMRVVPKKRVVSKNLVSGYFAYVDARVGKTND